MRLHRIADLLKGFHTVLDIGTDHGLVLKYAFDQGYIKNGIASDVNKEPLSSAKQTLNGYPVTFHLSNGFEQITEAFDAAVICGMGAHLITDIMHHAPQNEHVTYILGAHDKVERLRRWLADNGFTITDETVVFDKFYYQLIVCKRGTMTLDEKQCHLGPVLMHKKEADDFYHHQFKYYQALYKKVPQSKKNEIEKLMSWYQKT